MAVRVPSQSFCCFVFSFSIFRYQSIIRTSRYNETHHSYHRKDIYINTELWYMEYNPHHAAHAAVGKSKWRIFVLFASLKVWERPWHCHPHDLLGSSLLNTLLLDIGEVELGLKSCTVLQGLLTSSCECACISNWRRGQRQRMYFQLHYRTFWPSWDGGLMMLSVEFPSLSLHTSESPFDADKSNWIWNSILNLQGKWKKFHQWIKTCKSLLLRKYTPRNNI